MKNYTVNNINKFMKIIIKNEPTKTNKEAYIIAGNCLTMWKMLKFRNAEDMYFTYTKK